MTSAGLPSVLTWFQFNAGKRLFISETLLPTKVFHLHGSPFNHANAIKESAHALLCMSIESFNVTIVLLINLVSKATADNSNLGKVIFALSGATWDFATISVIASFLLYSLFCIIKRHHTFLEALQKPCNSIDIVSWLL